MHIIKGKTVALAGIAATLTLTLLSTGASASATPHDFLDGQVCTNDPSQGQLCMNADGTFGDLVYGKALHAGNEQNINVVNDGACGNGYVTESCPFTFGSGLNSAFYGKEIVNLTNFHSNLSYLGKESNATVVQGGTTDAGHEWVQLGNENSGWQWISVAVSDAQNPPAQEEACTQGATQPLLVAPPSLPCIWYLPS